MPRRSFRFLCSALALSSALVPVQRLWAQDADDAPASSVAAPPAVSTGIAPSLIGPLGGPGADPGLIPAIPSVGGTLPGIGAGEFGGLRQQLESAYGLTGAANTPGWVIRPSIGLQEEWTDNAYIRNGQQQSDLITRITPGLSVSGQTARTQVNLNYTPSVMIYARNSSQNRVAQNFGGRAQVIVVPDMVFLDARGFAAEQIVTGGYGPTGTTVANKQNSGNTYSFTVTPYAAHRFGDIGSVQVGYSVNYTSQATQNNLAVFNPLTGNFDTTNNGTTTQRQYGVFESGSALGRFSVTGIASAQQSQGQGVLNGAFRNTVKAENGYAVNRWFTGLVMGGWQDIHYSGIPPYNFNGGIWTVGFRVMPNPDSVIIFRYGRQNGVTAPQVQASYTPTPRLRFAANYSESVTTDSENVSNALSQANFDPLGNPVDNTTGAPLLLAGNSYGTQNNVYRQQLLSVSASYLLDRDTYLVSFSQQRRRTVAATLGGGGLTSGINSSGLYGSVGWQHQFAENLRSSVYFQYGTNTQTNLQAFSNNDTNTLTLSGNLTYLVTNTLSTFLRYSFSEQTGTRSSLGNQTTNMVVIGGRKTF